MDVLVFTFTHGLIPLEGFSFDSLLYTSKVSYRHSFLCYYENIRRKYEFLSMKVCYI